MIWYNEKHKERALKSFAAFVAENPLYVYKDNKWLCPHCDGHKRVIAPYERPDPVEGYKMADRIPCPDCGGSGETTEKVWREIFKEQKELFVKQKKEKQAKEALIKQALAKLTVSEQKALGVYRQK